MTESDDGQAGWIESMISDLRGESAASRRTFLGRSAAAGAGALALSVAGSNAALDPDISLWYSTQMPAVVWQVTMTFHVLPAIGLGFLAWVTWD